MNIDMKAELVDVEISDEEAAILNVLMYFDVFSYPLKPTEISQFVSIKMSPVNVLPCLNYLENNELIEHCDGYFGISVDQAKVDRRVSGNKEAKKRMKAAKFYAALIQQFPFVRGVFISGSMSKDFLDEDGDIDYFIVAKPSRVWVARTLLILFKKVFLLNDKKNFCVNYFIDTNNLEIPDKNIFTATEIKTLLPMSNPNLYEKFIEANIWSTQFLPMIKARDLDDVSDGNPSLAKRLAEFLFSGVFGEWADSLFMSLTIKRWQKKFAHFSQHDLDNAMRSRKYVSKHHPQNFQKKVLDAIKEAKSAFSDKYNVELP